MRSSPRDRIRIRAVVTNVTDGFREEQLPWCVVQARLYRDGALAFDQAAADRCGEATRVVRLRAGESERFGRTLTAAEVLGDSLSPGPFGLHLRIPGQTGLGPPRAEMDLPLGTVVLERPDTTEDPDEPRRTGERSRAAELAVDGPGRRDG